MSTPKRTTPSKTTSESVWDYPLRPYVEQSSKHIQVVFNDLMIADSRACIRVIQQGVPPVFYIPLEDVRTEVLDPSEHSSFCNCKGQADYFHVHVGKRMARNAAWCYRDSQNDTTPANYFAFYAHLVDQCLVDTVPATAPDWVWVGGWVTPDVAGPFITQKEAETLWQQLH